MLFEGIRGRNQDRIESVLPQHSLQRLQYGAVVIDDKNKVSTGQDRTSAVNAATNVIVSLSDFAGLLPSQREAATALHCLVAPESCHRSPKSWRDVAIE